MQYLNHSIILKALQYVGVANEFSLQGILSINLMLKQVGFDNLTYKTPWCGAFVGYVLFHCNCKFLKSLRARDYLEYGFVTVCPELGDIVVFWRGSEDATTGHVGFFVTANDTHVFCLGGNQNNTVSIQAYPINRVLGYRKALVNSCSTVQK